jgi:hypothetical protein
MIEAAHDDLVPVGTPGLVPFSRGDTLGQREHAKAHAFAELAKLPPDSVRAQLYALQAAGAELPEVEMPLQHVFAPGCYARTIFIPAGTFVVGKIHKHRHINILSQGEVYVLTESGGIEHLKGPLTMASEPGTKRALITVSDVTWTTIHITDLTDLDAIEDFVIAKTYEDYERFAALEGEHHAADL